MDFNLFSSGEIANSNSRENSEKIKALELRVTQLELAITQLKQNVAATNNSLQFSAMNHYGGMFK